MNNILVIVITESKMMHVETKNVNKVRRAVKSTPGAGRHEAAVERGSRSVLRLCRDHQ